MKKIIPTTRFKKDLKRYRNDLTLQSELYIVLDLLRKGLPLPAKYKSHKLVGNYIGCIECHVKNDVLLIWVDDINDIISLLRLGSHSELF